MKERADFVDVDHDWWSFRFDQSGNIVSRTPPTSGRVGPLMGGKPSSP